MFRKKLRKATLSLTIMVIFAVLFSQVGLASTILEEVRGKNGMVATASPYASEAALEILKAGGNAVDAAVAAAFAIGVAEPNASGLGGEGFMVIYLAETDQAISIDYRSTAPKASVPALEGQRYPNTGWTSVATPGTVAGLAMALEKYGTMTLAEVMAPAIRLAEEGFPVSEVLVGVINDNYEKILNDPAMSAVYLDDMLPPEAGYVIKNPDLAKTMRIIAEQGPDAFYYGEIGQMIVDAVQANGGYLSMEDLAEYRAKLRWPARGSYRGYDIIAAGPPVGGATVIEALHIMENFDIPSMGYPSVESVHIMAEALKRAYADNRNYIGDPEFDYVPLFDLLSKDYARERAFEIPLDAMTPMSEIRPGELQVLKVAATGTEGFYESPSTTHISVVDKDRNMVALTQTISSFFGAAVIPPGTGIVLNNEMANFSSPTAPVNSLEAGKRMKTLISPTLVLKDGAPFLTIGTPGAARIISTVTILLSNIIDHGMGLQDAIEAPRFYVRDNTELLEHESRFAPEIIEALKGMGYSVNELGDYDLYFGGAQGVIIDQETGTLIGGADPRRDGAAIGF